MVEAGQWISYLWRSICEEKKDVKKYGEFLSVCFCQIGKAGGHEQDLTGGRKTFPEAGTEFR